MHKLDYSVCMHVCMCLIILIILFGQYFSNSSVIKANSQLFPLLNRCNVNISKRAFHFYLKILSQYLCLLERYILYIYYLYY